MPAINSAINIHSDNFKINSEKMNSLVKMIYEKKYKKLPKAAMKKHANVINDRKNVTARTYTKITRSRYTFSRIITISSL